MKSSTSCRCFWIVELLLDDLLGRGDCHVDCLLSQLEPRRPHFTLQLAFGLLQELPGLVACVCLEFARDSLAPLHCLLHLLPFEALDLGDLGVERGAQSLGIAQFLLSGREIRGNLLSSSVEHREQRTPGVLSQHPKEDEECDDIGQQKRDDVSAL